MIYIAIITILITSISAVYICNLFFKFPVKTYSYNTIEGLRGYLAFFVFISHFGCWYHFLHSEEWKVLEGVNIFAHFGRTSVNLFFLITGFLFFDKLIRNKIDDWSEFLMKRFLRLFPMYFTSIMILIFFVLVKSNFSLNVPFAKFLEDGLNWLCFGFIKAPILNCDNDSPIINASVHWTLSYEILFYLCLPVIAAVFYQKKLPNWVAVLCSYLVYFYFTKKDMDIPIFKIFFFGWLIAWLNYKTPNHKFYQSKLISCCVIAIFYIIVNNLVSNYEIFLILLSVIFILIVKGNSIFGLLNLKVSQLLGQISYSVYLMHGIVIYFINTYLISKAEILNLTKLNYIFIGSIYGVVVIIVSFLTYRNIELSFLNKKTRFEFISNNIVKLQSKIKSKF